MKSQIFFVKSLENYLQGIIQRILRNPESLKSGKNFINMRLRPREVLGAFLICAAIKFISQQNWTIAKDVGCGDGMIFCMDKNRYGDTALLEQVYVRLRPKGFSLEEITEEINNQIRKKINKGKEYAKDRHLIIFLDVEGEFEPGRVKSFVNEIQERFDSYWLFAPGDGLDYFVFLLKAEKDKPAAYKVKIHIDFTGWEVEKLGTI